VGEGQGRFRNRSSSGKKICNTLSYYMPKPDPTQQPISANALALFLVVLITSWPSNF